MSVHDILTTVAALVAVILMILLVRYGTRFIGLIPGRVPPHGALTLRASLSLDQRRRLNLVSCHGHQLLLLTGGPTDLFLGWLPSEEPLVEDRP